MWCTCPYVTIAASPAEPTTHWDAVSELWVAMLLAAPYGNTAPAIALDMTTVQEAQINLGVGESHILHCVHHSRDLAFCPHVLCHIFET